MNTVVRATQFFRVLGESLEALLDCSGPQFTGALCIHLNVRNGEPDSATVGREEVR